MKIFSAALVLLLASCQPGADSSSELDSKTLYSILQSYEYRWRDKSNDTGCVIVESALNSEYDIIGIPLSGKDTGFSWLVLNPKKPELENQYIRVPADASVSLSNADIGRISKNVKLSPHAISALRRLAKSETKAVNSP